MLVINVLLQWSANVVRALVVMYIIALANSPLISLYAVRLLFYRKVKSMLRASCIGQTILFRSRMGQLISILATVAIIWYLGVFTAGSAIFTL